MEAGPGGGNDAVLLLRFEDWEGPIEALLDLARAQKVDLAAIDMIALVDQFEAVVGRAMELRLELAADWLVTASWLAYLKSRLLLRRPGRKDPGEPDEEELARALRRLAAVKEAAAWLPGRMTLGRDWFAPASRGAAAPGRQAGVGLDGLVAAYPRPVPRDEPAPAAPLKPFDLESVDAALERMSGRIPCGWTPLLEMVPPSGGLRLRSSVASSLVAALELARHGKAGLRQDEPFGVIWVRSEPDAAWLEGNGDGA